MSAKKILFLGTHGQYNIGDELLLETFLSQLGDQHEYMINTYDPDFTSEQLGDRFNIKVFHTIRDRIQILPLILKSDLVFFGGGSILKELYASVGRNRYATLFMILGIVCFAKVIGRKPIIMSNIGIGPVETKFGYFLTRVILSMVDYVSVRDQKSYNTCMELNIYPDKVVFVPDAVFIQEPKFFIRQKEDRREQKTPQKIALNLNFNIEHPEYWDLFINELAEGLNIIHQKYTIQIHALPMQSGYKKHNDLDILTKFQKHIPEIEIILHQPTTTYDMGEIIAGCDIVVAERLHTCITAALLGKPILPLIYDVKVRELVNLLGVEDFGLEIDATFSATRFAKTLLQLSDQARQVEDHLNVKTAAIRQQLRTYFQALIRRIEEV